MLTKVSVVSVFFSVQLTCDRWQDKLSQTSRQGDSSHCKFRCGRIVDADVGSTRVLLVRELVLCSRPAVVGQHLTQGLLVPVFGGQAGTHYVVAARHTLHYLYNGWEEEGSFTCMCWAV